MHGACIARGLDDRVVGGMSFLDRSCKLVGESTYRLSAAFAAGVLCASATRPFWNRRSMRTSPRMPQKRADLVRSFRRENVLKLASLLLDFGFAVHRQTIGKQPLRQAVPPNDICRLLAPPLGELND